MGVSGAARAVRVLAVQARGAGDVERLDVEPCRTRGVRVGPRTAPRTSTSAASTGSSASRIARGVFEIALSRGWIPYAEKALRLSKAIERRMWPMQTPVMSPSVTVGERRKTHRL